MFHRGSIGSLLMSLLLVAAIVVGTTAFLAPKVHSSSSALGKSQSNHVGRTNVAFSFASPRSSLSLSLSSDHSSYDSNAFPNARTDIRIFLTQRSIQSFVYLLNQCREEHTVRWLEKTLNFSSIDNFHGTGAFNQTKFPEWDSIFLDCINRPEEVMVIQIRQRRRQRKLSGYNAYFESMNSSVSAAGKKEKEDTEPRTINRAYSTVRNYLDDMKPTNLLSSTAKTPRASKTTSRKLSGRSDYLDSLSLSRSKKMIEKGQSLKDHGSKKNPTVFYDIEKLEKEDNGKSSDKAKKKSAQYCTGYLESLSFKSNAASSDDGSKDDKVEEAKIKQSTEISNNPFLDEKIQEYEFYIDPPSLVRRIISVREQLSKEWVEDLDTLIKLNDEITESFEEYNNKVATKDDEEEDVDKEDNQKDKRVERKTEDKDDDENSSDLGLLLEALVAPVDKGSDPGSSSVPSNASLGSDKERNVNDEEKRQTVFDRTNLNSWSQSLWSPNRSSSPYRKANFDLLLLLATQESIHRVLNSYKKDDTIRPQTHKWLFDFYTDKVNEHFDGHQTYSRSEDFLEELLKSPGTLIETNNDILAWVDPAIMAEDIVRERSEVALDWMRVAETILDEHTDLRRLLFTNMVSKSFPDESSLSNTILTAVKNEAEEDSSSSPTKVFGVFE